MRIFILEAKIKKYIIKKYISILELRDKNTGIHWRWSYQNIVEW